MGYVYSEITLKNATDVINCKRGLIKEEEIRETTVTAMVDTGAATLVINEELRRQLGLELTDTFKAELADGSKKIYMYSEPVQIQWKDRKAVLQAIVLPSIGDVLLGAIPLEAMDLVINPSKQELVGAHGDKILFRI